MKNLKRCLRIISGLLLISCSIWVWCQHHVQYQKVDDAADGEQQIAALPDYDYIAEIRRLLASKRFGEAMVLCEDVQKTGLPCAGEAKKLAAEAEKESEKIWNRIYKAGRAFITGNPDGSIEETGGSIVSDMVMYGDIRDLVKQGYFKLTRQETDPLVAALAAVGLATEFIDAADWAPAALKAMKKAGVISRKLADSLLTMLKKIIKTGRIDNTAETFFNNTKNLLDSAGFVRTKNMFKNVDSVDDLTFFAARTGKNPSLTHLVVKHSGGQSVEVLKNSSPEFLKHIIRKGRFAVRLMKSYHKHREVLEKTLWQKLPEPVVNGVAALLLGSGFILLLLGAFPFIYRKNKEIDTAP